MFFKIIFKNNLAKTYFNCFYLEEDKIQNKKIIPNSLSFAISTSNANNEKQMGKMLKTMFYSLI